ncbi:glycosyltransferase family 4 protein [Haloarchaeobius salinus]|uniref:glycosyltransferase family 4 protein n=1 Tax=Haloarchaeobius salinus TaxID=1198298 RepID=UPI002109B5FA|nr:glycosyltransferase family 4 protein [Haloarchaeobius salinus]
MTIEVLNLVTTEEATFFQKQCSALAERGIELETLAVPERPAADEHRSPLSYARLVPRAISRARDGFDIVHANNGLTAPAALAQSRLPVVISLWGTDLFGRFGAVSRAAACGADAVIVMSDGMAASLDVDAHVIPHGVDLDVFRPMSQDAARDRLGWRSDRYYVLFPYSTERAVKNYPRARRVVDEAATSLDHPVELTTVSGVDHHDMVRYYAASDALILTSRHEGSTNAVKEALACDTPVVSVDVGDVAERLAGTDRSRVCRSDEELVAGLVEVLPSEGEPGGERRAVTELGLERMAERIESVYRSVLAE